MAPTNMTGVGTDTPASVSDKALAAAGTAPGTGSSSTSKSNVITGVNLGIDPTTGKPIYPTDPKTGKIISMFKPGAEQTIIKGLPPKDRAALQSKMFNLGLYPKGYTPGSILTTEDFSAVQKLIAVGEQRGIGDLDAIMALAKKDKAVASFFKTGGYAATGTVSLTDTAKAGSDLTAKYLDLFNEKPTKDEVKAYQTAINARERSSKGTMTSQELEDIFLSVANKKIQVTVSQAQAGNAKAKDILDSGLLGQRVREIRAAYADNGIPVSDNFLYNQAGKTLRGQQAYDNVMYEIQQNAKTQWGELAAGVDKGISIKSQLQPYISARAAIRGIPESQIKISDMTDVLNADGTIKKYAQYKTEQYKSEDYLKSDAYKQTVLNDTQAVLRNFGIG